MAIDVSNPAAAAPAKREDTQDPIYLRIRDLVYQTCGIYHYGEKLYLLVAACQRRMATGTVKATNGKEYLDALIGITTKEWETI
jgi:hypothetical protein